MDNLIKDIVKPESGIEEAIIADPDFTRGAEYGKPRPGHPEGQVIYHIKDVLANIYKYYRDDEDYEDLRMIAIIHDTFKYKVDQTKPKAGENHHGMIARRFAEKYTKNNRILKIIELHDEAYNAWQKGERRGDWYGATSRAKKLISVLLELDGLDMYLKFYKCDNATGDKSSDNYMWFESLT
ncbi:MAG: HD domain-containing protein [Dehalococcoidia bacterium]|jgi:hypothetical protein